MKKSNSIFYLKDIVCSYNRQDEVLNIGELNIPQSKIVFVVGISGVGKSTFLETLACMHYSVVEQPKSAFFLQSNEKEYALLQEWKKGEHSISDIRKGQFSFIFQQSTFLEDCSALENMSLGAMLKDKSAHEVSADIIEWMERLDLPAKELHKNIKHFSGGQRQRMAFVRALVSPFQLLFCDEPTGNLDAYTGDLLMQLLKQHIHKSGRTAIVVTHDLRAALKYADQILVIKPIWKQMREEKKIIGVVSDKTYFDLSERREAADQRRLLDWIKNIEN